MNTANAARKAWIVAASIGGVEAMKDQLGFCRWNYPLRSLQQHAKTNLVFYSHHSATNSTNTSSSAANFSSMRKIKVKKTEESLDKVMHLSCWGPTSVRF